jgi:uncharacterized protein
MNKVYIVHGWDGNPEEPMHKWLKEQLEKNGFKVEVPKMPHPDRPEINSWIDKLKEVVKTPDENTYFIGHSVGCQGVLRYLESINNKIGGVVLIAPWMHLDKNTIEEEGEEVKEIAKPWMETPINWNKIKRLTNNFVCIFSDNDPYVPLSEKNIFEKNLDAKIIIEHSKGHFDPSSNIKDNITALRELLNFVEKIKKI